jgi:hypothetical protein
MKGSTENRLPDFYLVLESFWNDPKMPEKFKSLARKTLVNLLDKRPNLNYEELFTGLAMKDPEIHDSCYDLIVRSCLDSRKPVLRSVLAHVKEKRSMEITRSTVGFAAHLFFVTFPDQNEKDFWTQNSQLYLVMLVK